MSEPKRHHIISEMLQSRFVDEEGQLYFFDKCRGEKGVQRTNPDNLFVKRHAYSLINHDGTKDASLEKYYSKLEGVASEIIEKIVGEARRAKTPLLSSEEKVCWDTFVHQQWKRSPDFQAKAWSEVDFEASLGKRIAEFESNIRPLTSEEREEFESPEGRSRLFQNATVGALSEPGHLATEALDSRGLGIVRILHPKKSFIIGSSAVVKLALTDSPELTHPTTELWLPIAYDVAVSPAGPPGTERLVPVSDERHIRAINLTIAQESVVFAGRSRALVESLARPR